MYFLKTEYGKYDHRKLVPRFLPEPGKIPETDSIHIEAGGMKGHSYKTEIFWQATNSTGQKITTKKIYDDSKADFGEKHTLLW